jgi:hypothetical protein
MRTSFHHQPEAQPPNFQLSTSWQADYPIFRGEERSCSGHCPDDRVWTRFGHGADQPLTSLLGGKT